MFNVANVKAALAGYFHEQAQFRHLKAEQYPHETRNAASATALRAVAGYVGTLPDSDARLMRLARLPFAFHEDGAVFVVPQSGEFGQCDSSHFAIRCGFDAPVEPSEFLSAWVKLVEKDHELNKAMLSGLQAGPKVE
jgi:hypothetical protein